MTDYADVPSVTALHAEAELVASALAMLGAGGTMLSFTVGGVPPGDPPQPVMPVTVATPAGTVSPALLTDLTAWLALRQSDLNAQLGVLGVTGAAA